MSTAIQTEPRIQSVNVTDEAIVAHLADGRMVSVPLDWSWRLSDATPEQRAHWEIIGDGQGVRWPDIDEDISVEGMFRGTPARRPSRTETRILLDTSSLIDVERDKPLSFNELDRTLRKHHARLILTYTSVMEFTAPFELTQDRLALRNQLQQIERLPVGYLREGGIKLAELREAVRAFNEGRECIPIDPYVERWDETLVLEGPPPAEMLVNQSLYNLVSMALAGGSPIRRAEEGWGELLTKQFDDDRRLPAKTRAAIDQHFCETIRRHLAQHSIAFPPDRVKELADWIYSDPVTRCPGYRLGWEVRQEMMLNIREGVSGSDIFDVGHVRAVPYVDGITMDRNTADLCRRVLRRLNPTDVVVNYEGRIFASLEALLEAKFWARDAARGRS